MVGLVLGSGFKVRVRGSNMQFFLSFFPLFSLFFPSYFIFSFFSSYLFFLLFFSLLFSLSFRGSWVVCICCSRRSVGSPLRPSKHSARTSYLRHSNAYVHTTLFILFLYSSASYLFPFISSILSKLPCRSQWVKITDFKFNSDSETVIFNDIFYYIY